VEELLSGQMCCLDLRCHLKEGVTKILKC